MKDYSKLMYTIEIHSVEGKKEYFDRGGNPNDIINGTPLFKIMVEMYLRSQKFKDCIRLFIKYGLNYEDSALLAILSEEPNRLEEALKLDASLVNKRYFTFRNTFTSLAGATLLHYCAEYNHLNCAALLLQYGADVNAKAEVDAFGFGGHTPIFHTVAQNNNNSLEMLHFLLNNGADLSINLKGLTGLNVTMQCEESISNSTLLVMPLS